MKIGNLFDFCCKSELADSVELMQTTLQLEVPALHCPGEC